MFLTIAGIDSHGRPVYEDFFGHYWKDTNPDPDRAPKIVSALDDAFDGEPDIPYHGDDVKWLQWKLAKRGYDVGQIDGIFGWQTWRALVAFQKTFSKAPDGICGINTRGELKK